MRRCKNWGSQNLYLKTSDYLKAGSSGFFPEHSALFLISTLNSFRGCWRLAACSGHDVIFGEAVGHANFQSAGSLHSHICDHASGAFHGRCVPRCWEGSFPGLLKIPLTGHSVCCYWARPCKQQKSLDHTCLTSLLVQEIIPSCCFFPYLELHYNNHWSHMELNISILSQAQSHI